MEDSKVNIMFFPPPEASDGILAEAELSFDAVPVLDGLRLVGFHVRKAASGELYVTFPARAFGTGRERSYYHFLRGGATDVDRIKRWILEQFNVWRSVSA